MATTSILARLGLAATAVVAPAVLFVGAGTAQADVSAATNSAPGGVDVEIGSFDGPGPGVIEPSGWCTYTAAVRGNPIGKPLPAINVPFYLEAGRWSRLWFPSYTPGSTWDISVNCPNTGPQFTQVVW